MGNYLQGNPQELDAVVGRIKQIGDHLLSTNNALAESAPSYFSQFTSDETSQAILKNTLTAHLGITEGGQGAGRGFGTLGDMVKSDALRQVQTESGNSGGRQIAAVPAIPATEAPKTSTPDNTSANKPKAPPAG